MGARGQVIHYDIKSSNILLDTLSKHVTAKIADVGLSCVLQATQATVTDGHFMRGRAPQSEHLSSISTWLLGNLC